MEILFLSAVTFAAALINTVTGFGFGILTVALFALAMKTTVSVSVSSMISIILSGSLAKLSFRNISWKQLMIPLPFALAAGYLGVCFGGILPEHGMKRILGLVLVLLSVWFFCFSEKVRIRPTPVRGAFMGILGGGLQGMFGMGGPPMVLYYLGSMESKESYMATLQVYFVVMNVSVLAMRFQQGQISGQCWRYFGILLVPMFLGILLGNHLFRGIGGRLLRRISYGCMALCGIYFLIAG